MKIPLQLASLLSKFFTDAGIVGSDRATFRPIVPETVQLAYLLNPANVTNNVTQYGDAWTTGGQSFIGSALATAVAAQVGIVQLVNPAASGVDVFLDSIWVGAAGQYSVRFGMAATGNAAAGVSSSKDFQGAPGSGKAVLNTGNSAAPAGTQAFSSPGNTTAQNRVLLANPIRIPPGATLSIVDATANSNTFAQFEWREAPHV